MRHLKVLTLLGAFLFIAPFAHAQRVVVGVGVGPGYIGPAPVCDYGYYDYYPYACAPYGFWGPDYFYNGIFLGVGPWFGWGYGHGWGAHRFAGYYGGRGYGYGRGGYGYGRGGYGYNRGFANGNARGAARVNGYHGVVPSQGFRGGAAPGRASGGGFHGGGAPGGGFHGGGGRR